jgi:sn-glycerol 3-phosphate transport system substrate-binding protein
MVGLSTQEGVMPTGAIDWAAGPTDFSSATTAFLYHSTGSLVSINSQAEFEFGTAFLPKNKQFGTPTGGGNMYVFKGIPEERQQAAWTFVQWMTTTEMATQWSLASGYVPTRLSVLETQEWQDYVAETPQATTALEQLEFAQPELTGHQSGQLQKIMDDAIQAAVTEQESPEDALRNAQEQADSILSQFR